MAGFFRLLLGLALIPCCWGLFRAAADALWAATGRLDGFSPEAWAFIGGLIAFFLCWTLVSRPVRAYVLGHELTHALWGLFFGARPSDLKIAAAGGSVRLTKTNLLITLAPYFFPFYTFIVIVAALILSAFLHPLPFLPLWSFAVGFTWAFHVLFTISTLFVRQPDIRLYGRVFSWTLIFILNIVLVMLGLVAVTDLTFARLGAIVGDRLLSAYLLTGQGLAWTARQLAAFVRRVTS